ncbi:MAG: glycosyltransferase [Acidimicrobiia bacterium]|nr:glycosyltransferase [Acidimicrobiia bacterium]
MRALLGRRARRLRVGVFGYDLKFIRPILERLEADHGVRIRAIESGSLHAFPEDDIDELVRQSDVVVAEFFGPYVESLARLTGGRTPLVVRLHRFELHRGYADEIDPASIQRVVCVNRHYARAFAERTSWPADLVEVIPNAIDIDRFDRPKLPNSDSTVGLLGVASRRKRLDLALDTIDAVRIDHPDVVLSVKSHRPAELKWVMDDPAERAYFDGIEHRLAQGIAEGAVTWIPHGPDVETWLMGIGYVLSVSDDESFHMAPAEGMASGAIPVVRNWPGADTVYDPRWLFTEPSEAAHALATYLGDEDRRRAAAELARVQAEAFSLSDVASRWADLLVSTAEQARSR